MKNVKIFCKDCRKEILYNIDESKQKTTTIWEAEQSAICSDCLYDRVMEKQDRDKKLSLAQKQKIYEVLTNWVDKHNIYLIKDKIVDIVENG